MSQAGLFTSEVATRKRFYIFGAEFGSYEKLSWKDGIATFKRVELNAQGKQSMPSFKDGQTMKIDFLTGIIYMHQPTSVDPEHFHHVWVRYVLKHLVDTSFGRKGS